VNVSELLGDGLASGLRALLEEHSHLAAAIRAADAESALRRGREDELAEDPDGARRHYESVLAGGEAPVAPLVQASALAGIGRLTRDQTALDAGAALFASAPREQLGAAELSDWATCVEDQSLSIELHLAAAAYAQTPVLTLYELAQHAQAEGDPGRASTLL